VRRELAMLESSPTQQQELSHGAHLAWSNGSNVDLQIAFEMEANGLKGREKSACKIVARILLWSLMFQIILSAMFLIDQGSRGEAQSSADSSRHASKPSALTCNEAMNMFQTNCEL